MSSGIGLQLDEEKVPLVSDGKNNNAKSGNVFLCTSIALLAALSLGLSLGYSSPAIPNMKENNVIKTQSQDSWFGSLLTIGGIAGGPIAGILLDTCGRKLTLMLCAVPYVAGWVIIATVNSIGGLYLGRILTGVAAGMTSLVTPIYIAEMASPNLRGLLGSGFQLTLTIGILTSYILGIPLNYKHLAIVAAGAATCLIGFMSLMPDTPRYLLIKHHRDKALQVLEWLRGPWIEVELECQEIEDGLRNQEPFSAREFKKPSLYKPLFVSVMLMFFQQFSGVNAILFYTVQIFQTAAPSIDANVATVIVGIVQVAATAVAAVLMDRAGRRILLVMAGIAMALSSTTFGLYYKLTETNNNNNNGSSLMFDIDNVEASSTAEDLSWLSITSMVVYIIGYSLGWGPVPWLIMSEVFPSKARGAASSIATAFNWVFAFAVTKSFLALKDEDALGQAGVFWLFASVCVLGVIFVFFFVPETKGLALEEIEKKFSG